MKLLHIMMKSVSILLLFSLIAACDFGPTPDKVVEMTLELDETVNSDQEMNLIIQKLHKRLQRVAKNVEILALSNNGQIKITIPTFYEIDRLQSYTINPGKLDFYETYKNDELIPFIIQANELAKREDTTVNPLYDLMKKAGYQGGPVLFYVEEKDTAMVKKYFSKVVAESALPAKKRYIKFLWGIKEEGTGYFPLYALKKNRLGKPALSGDVVTNAFPIYNALDQPAVSVQMNEDGAKKWEDLTAKAFQERSNIAIVLNDQVYSAPGVSAGAIRGGRSEISGDFTKEEVQDFANILMSGSIPKMSILEVKVTEIK